MKKILFLLLLTNLSFAQINSKDDLVNVLTNQTCECLNAKDLTGENLELTLGVCIIQSIQKNNDYVDKYFGKNVLSNEDSMTEIAESIGVQLALNCPKFTNLLSNMSYTDEENEEEYLLLSGKISAIKYEQFLTFSVKENSGKTNQFILLSSFDNAFLLTDKILKTSDNVEVSYYEMELFDAKFGKFVSYKIVTDIIKK